MPAPALGAHDGKTNIMASSSLMLSAILRPRARVRVVFTARDVLTLLEDDEWRACSDREISPPLRRWTQPRLDHPKFTKQGKRTPVRAQVPESVGDRG